MIEYLNPQNLAAALLVVVPVLVFVASMLGRAQSLPFAPAWLDVTTWPRWAQPIVPFVAAAGPVLVTQLQAGVDLLPALEAAGAAGFGAIGFYHAAKRALPSAKAAVVGAVLLLAVGCRQPDPCSPRVAAALDEACAEAVVQGVATVEDCDAAIELHAAGCLR